jgi:carbonic anhydrase/acetyltransferase-like protein (isoleucine patch superfamily)
MIDVMSWWGSYILITLAVGKLLLVLLKIVHEPKEGLFKMDSEDKDYRYFILRAAIKKQIFWVWNNFCFPWATNLAFKILNLKADFKSTLFDGWCDTEFIELGDNIMLGQGSCILSSVILGDYLLVKKVVIGDHVVIGGNAIVAPGTIIGKNTTLGVWAKTHINQKLEKGWIYVGSPARKYKPSMVARAESKKVNVRRIVNTGEKIPMDLKKFTKKDKIEK